MDPILAVLVVVVIVGALGWWLLRRRRPEPVEDEWVLPPESGAAPRRSVPQVLDRDALLNVDRALDPAKWDNSPDADADGDGPGAEPPQVLDRDALRRRAAGDPDPGDAGEEGGTAR
ncbi:hypothetical protein PROP_02862 [Propionicimonas sp. T2.31MG-18]|uniref:hypothetical protein n=1 Tax=Propionicimonas sp. T2.31MG-18 TaxID=3157620 RepID=UPI0035E8CD8D